MRRVDVGVALFDSLGCDFMFLHPETLDERCHVDSNTLLLDNKTQYNTFTTLILPACRTISLTNMEKIHDFATAGGVVIFTSCLPQKATLAADNSRVVALVKALTDCKKTIFVEQPSPQRLKAALEQQSAKQSVCFATATN